MGEHRHRIFSNLTNNEIGEIHSYIFGDSYVGQYPKILVNQAIQLTQKKIKEKIKKKIKLTT